MEPLPNEFHAKGHQHRILKRTNGLKQDIALVERWNPKIEGITPHYEVVKIGKQQAGEVVIGGQTIVHEEKEIYPNEKQWGTDGFTYQYRDNAERKFDALTKRGSTKS